jgi:hypothetical protein
MIQHKERMNMPRGAPKGNTNAKGKTRTRVSACLSISDQEPGLLSWVIDDLKAKGTENPTDGQISRHVKDACYEYLETLQASGKQISDVLKKS